jgi:glycosyltransferase 2 family protein
MDNQENRPVHPQIRPWRYVPILIILGLGAYVLLPQIDSLQHSWMVVSHMIWWAVALAVISQVLSYLGAGYMLHAIQEIGHQKLPIWKGALITMGSASIGLVAGDWVGSAAATYGWIYKENHDGNAAAMAGTLPALLDNVVMVLVTMVGVLYLLLMHDLVKAQLIEFGIVLIVLILLAAGGVLILRYPKTATRLVIWLAGRWSALRRKPFSPNPIIAAMNQFIETWQSLRKGNWERPMLGAIANLAFDILTVYFLFIAAGHSVSFGILIAGYGLPFILGKMAFILPGGVGVIEAGMVAIYDSLKVPNAVSVVVILGYRLFSFWLPTLLGFAIAAYLSGKLPSPKGEPA